MSGGAKTLIAAVVVGGVLYWYYVSSAPGATAGGAGGGGGEANAVHDNKAQDILDSLYAGGGGTPKPTGPVALPNSPAQSNALATGRITGPGIVGSGTGISKYTGPTPAAIQSGRVKCNGTLVAGICRPLPTPATPPSQHSGSAGTSSTGYHPAPLPVAGQPGYVAPKPGSAAGGLFKV